MGRPRILMSAEQAVKFFTAIEQGCYLEDAADLIGVSRVTVSKWKQFGIAEIERAEYAQAKHNQEIKETGEKFWPTPKYLDSEMCYVNFYLQLVEKESRLKTRLLSNVVAAAEKNWLAAMTLLERRFGMVRPREVTNSAGQDAVNLWQRRQASEALKRVKGGSFLEGDEDGLGDDLSSDSTQEEGRRGGEGVEDSREVVGEGGGGVVQQAEGSV